MFNMTWTQRHISPTHLFLAGMILIPAFILQRSLIVRAAEIALFSGLVWVIHKNLKVGISLVILIFVAFFNILTPSGKPLFRIFRFPITDRALFMGLFRGMTLVGLFFISRLCIGRDLRLPGRIGSLLSRVLTYFHRFLQEGFPNPARPVQSLDRILLRTYESVGKDSETSPANTSWQGGVVLFVVVLLCWTAAGLNLAGIIPSHV